MDAHLVFFISGLESWKGAFDDEGGEFFTVYLRKHKVNVGEAAIGDPHLLSVEDIVRSLGVEFRPCQRVLRVRPRLRLR